MPTRIVALMSILCAACGVADGYDAPAQEAQLETVEFASIFAIRDTLVPYQSDASPIIRVSGVDTDSSGRWLLADVSESNVRLFASDGSLLATMGRSGRGPGEFTAPRLPRFGPDGRIYVADATANIVSVFDDRGSFVQQIQLFDYAHIMGFEVLPDQSFLITASKPDEDAVLFHLDPEGNLIESFLPIANTLPPNQSADAPWRSIRQFWLDYSNGRAFVVATLADSLWVVDLNTRGVERWHLNIPGYIAPTAPARRLADARELIEWSNSFHLASRMKVSGEEILIAFTQGVLNYGDPTLLVYRNTSGRWYSLTGAPPLADFSRNTAMVIHDPRSDTLVMARYERR